MGTQRPSSERDGSGNSAIRRRQPFSPAGIGEPIREIESWSTCRLSGRESLDDLVATHSMTWYFAKVLSARRRNVMGYIRTHCRVSRSTPAQHTVSP